MVSTFESLPTEIQKEIFNSLSGTEASDIRECILVCKSWKSLFKNPLYNSVCIYSYPSSARFLRTLKKNQYLRGLVKELTLSFEMDGENPKKNLTIAKLFAYLPNLECIDFSDCFFMKNLLHALVLRYLQKLNNIRVISLKSEEIEYNTCAILIKDRLKNVWINELHQIDDEEDAVDGEEEEERVDMYTDDETDDGYDEEHEFSETEECFREETDDEVTDEEEQDEEEIRIEEIIRQYVGCEKVFQLFDKLDQFKSIKVLTIEKKPENIIHLIETVTENCAHLQQLNISFDSSNTDDGFKFFDIKKINSSNSVSDVIHLTFNRYACNDPQLIHYIMRKFPKLKVLELPVVPELDENAFNRLLNYLSCIESIVVPNISWKQQTLMDSLDPFWNATLQARNLSVEFNYNCPYYDRQEKTVQIQNGSLSNKICYSPSLQDEDYIDKYSCYINSLTVSGLKPTSLYSSLMDVRKMQYEVLQPLKDCTKLKRFTILGCMLTEANVSGYELFRKQAFGTLRLIDCSIDKSMVFERLFNLFASIGYLELSDLQFENMVNGHRVFRDINIENTNIGILSLSKLQHFDDFNHERIILVKLSMQKHEGYFMYNFDSMKDLVFKPIKKQQFQNESNRSGRFVFGVRCKSLAVLKVSHIRKVIKLKIN